ncbi:MAG: hypothetical protein AM326_00815 [Candidatus Thorarchaeota archaeon SMTZ-45]|nr:MAG: hypothetical protein AM326_00815 [Candidatus Thorarchaeota archaeon SMTZ-45]
MVLMEADRIANMIIAITKKKIIPVPMKMGMTTGKTYSAIPRNWKSTSTKIIGAQKLSPMTPPILQPELVPLLTSFHCHCFPLYAYKQSLDERVLKQSIGIFIPLMKAHATLE